MTCVVSGRFAAAEFWLMTIAYVSVMTFLEAILCWVTEANAIEMASVGPEIFLPS